MNLEKKTSGRMHTWCYIYISIFINRRAAATYLKDATLEITVKHVTKNVKISVLGFGKQIPVRASPTLCPKASLMVRQSGWYLDRHLIKQEKIREQQEPFRLERSFEIKSSL